MAKILFTSYFNCYLLNFSLLFHPCFLPLPEALREEQEVIFHLAEGSCSKAG